MTACAGTNSLVLAYDRAGGPGRGDELDEWLIVHRVVRQSMRIR